MSDISDPKVHFFVCVNEKPPENMSCARNTELDALAFFQRLKEESMNRWGKKVRINKAGCLGKCANGVVAVMYPTGKWYLNLKQEQFEEILNEIEINLA